MLVSHEPWRVNLSAASPRATPAERIIRKPYQTNAAGDAGAVTLTADTIELDGSIISSSSGIYSSGTGDAGAMTVTADAIELRNSVITSGILSISAEGD